MSDSLPVLARAPYGYSRELEKRNAPVLSFDIDLSTARSFAAGTALRFDSADGNSLMIDQDPSVGNATMYLQSDQANTTARIYVGPGFIIRAPFSGLSFENAAQPGRILRVLFGMDIDFQPGLNQAVTITGFGAGATLGVYNVGLLPASIFSSTAALVAATPEVVATFSTNGGVIHRANAIHTSAATSRLQLSCNLTGFQAFGQGDFMLQSYSNGTSAEARNLQLANAQRFAASRNIQWIADAAEVGVRGCGYTLS